MIEQNEINEIRKQINIVDVISEYVPLVKKGNSYWGLCPFHNDKNPSMSVEPNRQIYRCWSCNNSGNVFGFISQIENISFFESVLLLANKIGYNLKNKPVKRDSKYSNYYEIYDIAAKYFELMLTTPKANDANKYLEKRGFDKETIKKFKIGFALDEKDRLLKYLTEKKYDLNTLNILGLINNDIDSFTNRIMFPLEDPMGRVVGFSGRIYTDSKTSKYINTKETPIFIKGNCLYNYHLSKEYVREKKYVILMEGFMDVIRASTIGINNVVALMGTALSKEQISLLKKLSINVYLALDGDEPGVNATLLNGEALEEAGLNVKVIKMPNDEDPDSYIIKNGKEAFEALIENALNFIDFKISNYKNKTNFEDDLELSNYINKVLREISNINDEIREEILLKKLEKSTNVGYNTLSKKLNELKKNKETKKVIKEDITKISKKVRKDKYIRASEEFIFYMLISPKVIDIYDNKHLFFPLELHRRLAGEISYYYSKYHELEISDFYTYLSDKEDLLEVCKEISNLDLVNEINMEDINEYEAVISSYNKGQKIKSLENEMREATNEEEQIRLLEEIRLLRIKE